MAVELRIGLLAEGTTDHRFLQSIIKRTFEEIRFECRKEIDIYEVDIVKSEKGTSFFEKVKEAAEECWRIGINVLCVHTDADDSNSSTAYEERINPALEALRGYCEKYSGVCKIWVAIVPVQEVEAWMLADKELLKRQLGTTLSDNELGIQKKPESFTDPKSIIEEAITIAQQGKTKRKRHMLSISELYLPIGQGVDIEKLDALPSYQDFKENIRKAFREMNLLH